MDYEDIFAPVAKMTIICTFIIVASVFDGVHFNYIFKMPFLNGDLPEKVYMVSLSSDSYQPSEVYKLEKDI